LGVFVDIGSVKIEYIFSAYRESHHALIIVVRIRCLIVFGRFFTSSVIRYKYIRYSIYFTYFVQTFFGVKNILDDLGIYEKDILISLGTIKISYFLPIR
jgi:hypothetical protein